MKDIDFAYAVANVRAMETELITPAFTESLISSASFEAAKRQLSERGYKGLQEGTDISEVLSAVLPGVYDFISDISPKKDVIDFLIIKNDFHNLKAILKAAVLGDEEPGRFYITPCVFSPSETAQNIKEKNFDKLPAVLKEAAQNGYSLITSTLDGQLLDVYLDKCSLEASILMAKESGSNFAASYSEESAAIADIKIALRASKAHKTREFILSALCPCGLIDTEDLSAAAAKNTEEVLKLLENTDFESLAKEYRASNTAFEKACDDRLTALLKSAEFESFGPAPLIAYYCAKETEVKAIRIIMSCKRIGIEPSKIKERMRNLYV